MNGGPKLLLQVANTGRASTGYKTRMDGIRTRERGSLEHCQSWI